MGDLLHDVRQSLRGAFRNPGFTLGVTLILGLGIGANTAVFSIVNAFLLRPLPFAEPDRLVHVWETKTQWDSRELRVSVADYLDYREQSETLEDLGGYYYGSVNIARDGDPLRVQLTSVTPSLVDVLGVEPMMGRGFTADDGRPGQNQMVLLSQRYWRRHLNSDPGVVGDIITLDGEDHTIVGVMPESFEFPLKATMMWKPLVLADRALDRDPGGPLMVVGRMKPEVTMAETQAELATIAGRLAEAYPETNSDMSVNVVTLREAMVFFYDLLRMMFLAMLLATGFVTLIVCANVGNLLLARCTGRTQELAIRSALGAGRWRLVRHLLADGFSLALLGGLVGVGLAVVAVRAVGPAIPEDLYRAGAINVDGRVLAFTIVASAIVALLCGLAPALTASRVNLNQALRSGDRGASGGRTQRLHGFMVVSEISLAVVLVVSSILMVRSFINMQDVDPGFNPDGVLTAEMILPDKFYESRESWNNFYDESLQRLRARPEVVDAAVVYPLPMNFEALSQAFVVEGRPFAGPEDNESAAKFWVDPDFFRTMEIPVQFGRSFNDFDTLDQEPVVVVNETMVARHFPGEDPVGQRLRLNPGEDNERLATVVGICGDMKHFLMTDAPTELVFVPQAQQARNRRFFLVRTAGDPMQHAALLRQEIDAIDAGLPLTEVRSMREVVDTTLGMWGGTASAFAGLGIGALLLAVIGLYSLISYSVGQRVRELGIRIALGAQSRDVILLVMKRGLWLTAIGVAIGTAGALLTGRLLESLLFGLGGNDPMSVIATVGILFAAAMLACYLPTRKATRVDPMIALRAE